MIKPTANNQQFIERFEFIINEGKKIIDSEEYKNGSAIKKIEFLMTLQLRVSLKLND